jgi:alpha-D-ribose 1-methylphosphonate 5-triphosphate diphosphatase
VEGHFRISSTDAAMALLIRKARALIDGALVVADIGVAEGRISLSAPARGIRHVLEGEGLFALPGIVDIHGDAFERQIMPRPNVGFDPALALAETDRQMAANGITTAFHGVTWSWEPGLRGTESVRRIIAAIIAGRPGFGVDTRIHLRHETFNLEAEPQILAWIEAGLIDALAFNDHMSGTLKERLRPDKRVRMMERTGLGEAEFDALVERIHAKAGEVPHVTGRLAAAAREARLPMLSHDDMSPEQRDMFRSLGVAIAEFPINEPTARAAIAAGDFTVFGAPNVVRGGSHTGCPSASEMAGQGLCSILASDYFYPAILAAPFMLAERAGLSLAQAWPLVSANPAAALGRTDRGRIAEGARADLILVDASDSRLPRVVATIAGGRIIHMAGADRLAAA